MNGLGLFGVPSRCSSMSAVRRFLPGWTMAPFGVRGGKDGSRAHEVGNRALIEFGATALEIADNVHKLQVYSYRGGLSSAPDRVIRAFERVEQQPDRCATSRKQIALTSAAPPADERGEEVLPGAEVDKGVGRRTVSVRPKPNQRVKAAWNERVVIVPKEGGEGPLVLLRVPKGLIQGGSKSATARNASFLIMSCLAKEAGMHEVTPTAIQGALQANRFPRFDKPCKRLREDPRFRVSQDYNVSLSATAGDAAYLKTVSSYQVTESDVTQKIKKIFPLVEKCLAEFPSCVVPTSALSGYCRENNIKFKASKDMPRVFAACHEGQLYFSKSAIDAAKSILAQAADHPQDKSK